MLSKSLQAKLHNNNQMRKRKRINLLV
uniref:Uncharacterized protein n=1 Tax=Rhizophora mucronata TaxID=61149 RepID=A0A2P2P4I6_RHIMU